MIGPMIDHVPPKPFPPTSLVGVAVPTDFNKVILAAAKKNGLLYEDQLLTWAQMGAECSRMHKPNGKNQRRKK